MPFPPGTFVKVFFDRSTNFNGCIGRVAEVSPAPSDDDVPVKMLTGSEAGTLKFFAPYEIRAITPLGVGYMIHMDTLMPAVEALVLRELTAAAAEGIDLTCVFKTISVEEATQYYRTCFEFGHPADTSFKSAYIVPVNGWEYLLVWK